MKNAIALISLLAVSTGALADIKATPVHVGAGELCVVDNPKVQQNFRDLMLHTLALHGHTARMVQATTDCPVTMTFDARYAMSGGYRRVLKISSFVVYRDGEQIGSVNFRFSHTPLGNGTVEEVVQEMISRLFGG
jgi:hypothetical protein